MKIQQIRIKKFKRFTDTTIEGPPQTTKLVMLVGPNGSGKSSLMDAAYTWKRYSPMLWNNAYHRKQIPGNDIELWHAVEMQFHDVDSVDVKPTSESRAKAIYVRSAYRNEPEFNWRGLKA
jgi:AAA15 family ATPase/GTPase